VIVPENLRALVVDDNGYARQATSATLRKLGLVSIDEVESAARAIGQLMTERYDVVFMDWYMPDMNGAALLQIVRHPNFGRGNTVPMIMMTAYPNRETIARARSLGAAEVLTKPFNSAHVAAALGKVLPDGWQAVLEPDAGQAGHSQSA
jgi:two-component system chemotaxis response regulator CheY